MAAAHGWGAATFLLTTPAFVAKAWAKTAVALVFAAAAGRLRFGIGQATAGGLALPAKPAWQHTAPNNTFFDIVGSVFGLLLTAVMIPILALAIKPRLTYFVIFRQQRGKQGGRPFTHKFAHARQRRNDGC
ncbi:MAG: sugar transferase [Ardenticatenaceae bacterium]|nr:sugar transferase [Ardenticatenaceae bacterium]